MKKKLVSYKEEVRKVIDEYFLPVFDKKIDDQVRLIAEFEEAVKSLMSINYLQASKKEALREFMHYKRTIEEVTEAHLKNRGVRDFDKEFADFNNTLILKTEGLDEVIIEEQHPQRFKSLAGDSLFLKIGKGTKRFFRFVAGSPLTLVNLTRKTLKKEPKERAVATHQIRLRNLARFFYKEKLSADLSNQLDACNLAISNTAELIWSVDIQITHVIEGYIKKGEDIRLAVELTGKIPEAKNRMNSCRENIKVAAHQYLETQHKAFLQAFERVGTFELANRRFRVGKTARLHYRLNQNFLTRSHHWNNTLAVLSDDWGIDLELFAMMYHGLTAFYENSDEINLRIDKHIQKEIRGIINEVDEAIKRLKAVPEGNTEAIKATLAEQLNLMTKGLVEKLLPQANEVILTQDLPSLINAIEAGLSEEMKQLSAKRAVIKGINYTVPVKTNAISYIAPGELINFESWPYFVKAGKACRVKITAGINNLQQELSQLGQIAIFNIESALALIDDGTHQQGQALGVALEGLHRTVKKAESLNEFIAEIKNAVNEELFASLQNLNTQLEQLTDNENIYQIRVRIAKAKALERSRALRKEWINKIRNLLPLIWNKISQTYTKVSGWVIGLSERYGLSKNKPCISTEIADFLAETEQSIEKLPFVYQRLFKSEPLQDPNHFEGRKMELNALNSAYNNFMKGRFAATAIVAEKGSGITTLLNFFEEGLSTSCEVLRFDTTCIIQTKDELVQFFSEELGTSLKSVSELVDTLNSGKKKVIIVENLQKMFLKRVNGFEALTMFLEVISFTSKNVFWLTSCTLYAWNYLNKTLKISSHFGYQADMNEFENEMITKIINKRHQVSGYNLLFEPSPFHLNNKKFKKMDTKEQQSQLQREYFNDLNKIAKSNISLALMYWLRSTCEVTKDTIYIASLKEMDFAFMRSFSTENLHMLNFLLLHDGLNEEQFGLSLNRAALDCRAALYPMYEDGILVKKGSQFLINPLLYRQSVELLKTKNIIH